MPIWTLAGNSPTLRARSGLVASRVLTADGDGIDGHWTLIGRRYRKKDSTERQEERWPSGRRQRFAKPSQGQKLCRGFKSRPLRHSSPLRSSKPLRSLHESESHV